MKRKAWMIPGVLLILVCIVSVWSYQVYTQYKEKLHIQAVQDEEKLRIQALHKQMEVFVTQEEYAKADASANEILKSKSDPEVEKRRKEIDELWLKQRLRNNVKYWRTFEEFYDTH